jgi:hypothetical protein
MNMFEEPSDLIKLRTHDPSSHLWVVRRLDGSAKQRNMSWATSDLTPMISDALETLRADNEWVTERLIREGTLPNSRVMDPLVDDASAGVFNMASAMARAMPAGSPQHSAARTVLTTYFPLGLGAFTQQPMLDQLADVEDLIIGLRGRHAEEAKLLHLEEILTRLEELLPQYAASLGERSKRRFSHTEYLALRRRDHHALCHFAAKLLVRRHERPEERDDINALFAIIAEEQERQRLRNVPRRKARVNPDNGDEVAD